MARHYSFKSFFRHAPNAMLIKYFSNQNVLAEHDFSEVSETKIDPIYQAWLFLPDTQREEMERDFKEIDALFNAVEPSHPIKTQKTSRYTLG